MSSVPHRETLRDRRIVPLRSARHLGLAALVFLAVSCQRQQEILLQQAPKPGAALTSVVYTGDPDSAPQLVDGFFQIEEYSWRWTAQSFSVVLRPPGGATGE